MGGAQEVSYPDAVVPLAKELAGYTGANPVQAVEVLLACRMEARKEKNWELADKVRDGMKELGLVIEDTPQGPRVSVE